MILCPRNYFNVHYLETSQDYFEYVYKNVGEFEVMYDDKSFQVGDLIILTSIDRDYCYLRNCLVRITYISDDFSEDYIIFGFKVVNFFLLPKE